MINSHVQEQRTRILDIRRSRVSPYGDIVELNSGIVIADPNPGLDAAFV